MSDSSSHIYDLVVGQHTANILAAAQINVQLERPEAAAVLLDHAVERLGVADVLPQAPQPAYMDDDEPTEFGRQFGLSDPAGDQFELDVSSLAQELWAADPGKQTGARTFAEDYANNRDRYLGMAEQLLNPSSGKDGQHG